MNIGVEWADFVFDGVVEAFVHDGCNKVVWVDLLFGVGGFFRLGLGGGFGCGVGGFFVGGGETLSCGREILSLALSKAWGVGLGSFH